MKKLILLSTFFFSISVHALPDCPSDISVRWDNCYGTATYENGAKYVGEWKNDKRHGQGTITYANEYKYVGEWKNDKFHGPGTYTYGSEGEYVGEWKEGAQHGQGTFTFPDGAKYVGEWKNNKFHGQGTFTFPNGRKNVGFHMKGEYIPDICEGMGLVKGTESFGNCVNNLIDDL